MLVWATEIPVDPSHNEIEVFEVAREWIDGSPHHRLSRNDIPDLVDGETQSNSVNGERVIVGLASGAKLSIAGFRHISSERGQRDWTTTIIGAKTTESLRVSIRTHCHLLRPVCRSLRSPTLYGNCLTVLVAGWMQACLLLKARLLLTSLKSIEHRL